MYVSIPVRGLDTTTYMLEARHTLPIATDLFNPQTPVASLKRFD